MSRQIVFSPWLLVMSDSMWFNGRRRRSCMLLFKNLPAYWRYLDYKLRHFYSQHFPYSIFFQTSSQSTVLKMGSFGQINYYRRSGIKGKAAWTITSKESRMQCFSAVVWFMNTPDKRTAKKWSLPLQYSLYGWLGTNERYWVYKHGKAANLTRHCVFLVLYSTML